MRLLVTGSRDWKDDKIIRKALKTVIGDDMNVLVQGNARGADTVAANVAMELGWDIEDYPADWDGLGKKAGPMRNQEMVNDGADECFAFPLGQSHGTYDCVRRCRKAGIPVTVYLPTGEAQEDLRLF